MAGGGFVWLSRIEAHSSYLSHVLGPGCMISLALGVLFTPLASAATAGVHFTEAGLASGLLNTARQMGGSLGLAALATIAIDHTHSLLAAGRGAVTDASALAGGYGRAFIVAACLSGVAFLCSFVVPSIRATSRTGAEARETPEAATAPGQVALTAEPS